MNRTITICALCALVLLAAGCVSGRATTRGPGAGGSGHGWAIADLLAAQKIETTLDAGGVPMETEFHLRPDQVPEAVRQAMEAAHPGGHYIGAEKEWNGGQLYFELAKEIHGYEVEAMFKPDGTPHDQEIQIPAQDVPEAVRNAIYRTWPKGKVNAWEVIKNGAAAIVEYHVKLTDDGKNYKIIVGLDGALEAGYREIPAEIEAPIALPK